MLAAYYGHAPLVKLLIQHGADPNSLNDKGQSPLAGAVFKGESNVVEVSPSILPLSWISRDVVLTSTRRYWKAVPTQIMGPPVPWMLLCSSTRRGSGVKSLSLHQGGARPHKPSYEIYVRTASVLS